MKMTRVVIVLFLWTFNLQGQSIEPFSVVNNANYYDLSVQGISLHTSFGELATETLSEGDIHLSQGFLQTYFDMISATTTEDDPIRLTVGPNPFTDQFSIINPETTGLDAYLFDLHGRMLKTVTLNQGTTTLDGSGLPAGTYLLQVRKNDQPIFKTVKLIKL